MVTRTRARCSRLTLLAPAILLLAVMAGCSSGPRSPGHVSGPPTIVAAGDIAQGGSALANAVATGDLIRKARPDAVLTLGDNAYHDGLPEEYATRYQPTWGSFKDRTYPVPGNHEYHFESPVGYLGYFGKERVTNAADGGIYYAWNIGNGWRAYAMNTEVDTAGQQLAWLRRDLASHPAQHYILYAHKPRYSSGDVHGPSDAVCPLWDALAATRRLEIVLAGHEHVYERFAKMDCAGSPSKTGPRSFIVGTGGNHLYGFGTPQPGSQFRDNTDFGVLELVLHRSSYDWSFIASGRGWDGSTSIDTHTAGKVIDSGSQPTNGS